MPEKPRCSSIEHIASAERFHPSKLLSRIARLCTDIVIPGAEHREAARNLRTPASGIWVPGSPPSATARNDLVLTHLGKSPHRRRGWPRHGRAGRGFLPPPSPSHAFGAGPFLSHDVGEETDRSCP